MSIRFGDGCCCSCLYFSDNFNRSGGDVDADGVNITDSTRWEFTSGDWSIETLIPPSTVPERALLCNTSDSPILFYNSPDIEKRLSVSVRYRIDTVGDYVSILYGTDEIKVTKTGFYTYDITGGGETTPFKNAEYYGYITMAFLHVSDYPSHSLSSNKIIFSPGAAVAYGSDCMTFDVTETGYKVWGFKASDGVYLDNVTSTYSREKCLGYIDKLCGTVCDPDPIPDTLTLSIFGFISTTSKCNNNPSAYESYIGDCDDNYVATLADCASNYPDPDSFDYYTCACAANDAAYTCYCTAYNLYTQCVSFCPLGSYNGSFILDKIVDGGSPCTQCRYSLDINIEDYYIGEYAKQFDYGATTSCSGNIITGEVVTLIATLTIAFYDADTGECRVNVVFELPSGIQYQWLNIDTVGFCAAPGSIGQSFVDENTTIDNYVTHPRQAPFDAHPCDATPVTEDNSCGIFHEGTGGDCFSFNMGTYCTANTNSNKSVGGST